MTANGKKIAGRIEKPIPIQFSLGEGLDIGMDVGSAIDFTYELPLKFTGKIEHVTIELGPSVAEPTANTKRREAG
jgi:arylsulfatase